MSHSLNARFRRFASKIGKSKATPVAAAIAVITATFLGYFASQFSSDGVACDIRHERLISEGSPYLRYAREATRYGSKAPVYLELARLATDPDIRRQNGYLAIAAVNESIMIASQGQDNTPSFWPYPTDSELRSPTYYERTFARIEEFDRRQIVRMISSHDERFGEEMGDAYICSRNQSIAGIFSFMAILFSVFSVSLIALREYKNNA